MASGSGYTQSAKLFTSFYPSVLQGNNIATTQRHTIEDQALLEQCIDQPITPAPPISVSSTNNKLNIPLTPPATTESPSTDHSFYQSPPLLSLSTWSSKLQDDDKVYDFPRPSLDRSDPPSPSEDDSSSIATIEATNDLCPSTPLFKSDSNHSMNSLSPPQQSLDTTRCSLAPSTIAQHTFMVR